MGGRARRAGYTSSLGEVTQCPDAADFGPAHPARAPAIRPPPRASSTEGDPTVPPNPTTRANTNGRSAHPSASAAATTTDNPPATDLRAFLLITRALGDAARVRALLSLADGELCVCHLIQLLNLAPSTVSKHMSILYQAGLVERRKDGRWQHYRLRDEHGGDDTPPVVRDALRWVREHLSGETVILDDAARLCCLRAQDPAELTNCYTQDRTG